LVPLLLDLISRDQKICPRYSRVGPDTYPKVVGDFVIGDDDVCILFRDFDPASLTGGIVQINLAIDDLIGVDHQGRVVQHVYLPAWTQATPSVKKRNVMIVLQGVASDRTLLGIT
jgi:hypothetical protein